MGMNTHVIGIIPPDAKWRQMKQVWDSCKEAGVEPPVEVRNFFNNEPPDEAGVVIDIENYNVDHAPPGGKSVRPGTKLPNDKCVRAWTAEGASGFEVNLDRLPPHVRILRFYNSY